MRSIEVGPAWSLREAGVPMAALGLAVVAGLGVAPVTPARAQGADRQVLEEVVVTARRREEVLEDVPVAISVLGSNFLAESAILDHYDLYAETPGIEYNESRERLGSRPSIRGVSTTAQEILLQKVTAFIDGVPLLGNTGSLLFTDLERIEVLRGPQSTAFGRSTFAGALNYVTRDPGDEFTSTFKLATSDLSRNVVGLSLDGPINDTLGFTLDLFKDEFDGPDEWVATDSVRTGNTETEYFAGKLKWAPNDRFDMEVRYSRLDAYDGPSNETFVSAAELPRCTNTVLPNGELYIRGEFECDLSDISTRRNHDLTVGLTPGTTAYNVALANSVLEPYSGFTRDRIQAEFNFSMDDGSLLQLITAYSEEDGQRWHDQDQTDEPVVVNTMTNMVGMSTQNSASPRTQDETYVDVRWLSPGDERLRWLVGLSYYDFTRRDDSYREYAGILLGLEDELGVTEFRPNRRQFAENTATGIYGNVTYDVTDRTTLSAEVRYQEDDRTTIEPIGGTTTPLNTDSVQPRFAINHALTDDWSVYGQYSQGTNPAHTNVIFSDPVIRASLAAAGAAGVITYDDTTFSSTVEEELTNIEIGIKGNALDGRLRLAAAVYAMDWQDMILGAAFEWEGADPDPVTGCAGIPGCWNDGSFDPNGVIYQDTDAQSGMVFINRGDGDLKGIEFEATWQATDNWSFRGALTLQDNEYAKNCDQAPVNDMGFTPTLTVADDGVLFDCFDVAGNTIEDVAEESASLSATYRAALGNSDWEWMGRLGVRYTGPQYIDVANLAEIPAASDWNGTLSLYNNNWEIMLFGTNLTDDDTPRQLRGLQDDRSLTGPLIGNFNFNQRAPREIGLRVNYTF